MMLNMFVPNGEHRSCWLNMIKHFFGLPYRFNMNEHMIIMVEHDNHIWIIQQLLISELDTRQ